MSDAPLPEGLHLLTVPAQEVVESPCETCGSLVTYAIHRSAPGSPEFVNVREPETALLGWMDGGPAHPDHVRLILICSRVCLVAFRDGRRKEEVSA